ncbi:HAD-like domain-containing protein [Aspergillus desertorum]
MDINRCGLGIKEPVFRLPSDLQGIQEDFYEHGIAFLKDCDEAKLSKLASQLGEVVRPRNEEISGTGISNIRFEPSLVGRGYSSDELYFHTDRSGWDRPPRILVSTLKSKSINGGASMLADTTRILQDIKEQGEGFYELLTNSKHSSFRSDDGLFVPRPIFDESSRLFRFRFDDGIQLSACLVIRFPQLFDTIYRNSFAVALEEGQGYLLDNHRYLHGRTSFTGSRELLRALVNLPPPESVVAILFDIDGTLCRSEEMSIDAFYSCLSDIVGKPITHENTAVSLQGRTDLGLLQDILNFHKVESKASVTEKFLKSHPKYLAASLEKGFNSVACQGVKDLLEWLMARKKDSNSLTLKVGLLTGNSRVNALLKIRAAGIDTEIFDLSISAFGDTHPDRISLIQGSMDKLRARDGPDIREGKVIIVGDTPLDIECAKKAGCAVVAVASGNYNIDDLAMFEPDHACTQIGESKAYLESHLRPSVTSLSLVGD